ncbi:MAG: beta strand repeat-containing protein, partial [Planctomyces sp.]
MSRRHLRRTESLESRILLTSGLTEILQYTGGYTVPVGGLEIEIGGYEAGNPAGGSNDDGFDQIQVLSGSTNLSTGVLDIRLVNNFVPNIGDRFNFLQISGGSPVSTTFPLATGMFSFPAGDRYFDIISDGSGGLTLEVKGFLNGLSMVPQVSDRDVLGRFLGDYFAAPSFTYTGQMSVAGLASISGNFILEQSNGETLAAGTGLTASMTGDSSGLAVTNATFGLIVSSDGNYALEAAGDASLSGLAGVSLGGTLSLERNSTGTAVNRTVTVSSTTAVIDVPASARQFAGNNLTLTVDNYAALQGNFAFDQASGNLRGVATSASGALTAGTVSAGLTGGTLAMVATPQDKLALEAQGTLSLSATGISSATASVARLRYNSTNTTWTGQSISIGGTTATFADLPQSPSLQVLSLQGLSARLGNFVTITGNAAIQKDATELQAVITNASATAAAGSASAGVSTSAAALVLDSTGSRQFFAEGSFQLNIADIGGISGTAISAQNTFASARPSRSITVDGTTVTLPSMTANLQSLAANAQFTVENFITASGNLVIDSGSQTVTLHDGSTLSADVLKIGGSSLTGFAGLNGPASNPNAAGISLHQMQFGVVAATDPATPGRRWLAGIATVESIAAQNLTDTTLESSSLALSINRPDSSGALVNFAASPVSIATAAADSITLNTASSEGSHAAAAGTVSGVIAGFADASGSFKIKRTVTDSVARLHVGATNLQAFVGNQAGTDSAKGVQISSGTLGMIVVAGTSGQPARYAVTASGQAGTRGLSDLTLSGTLELQAQRFGAAIDETISVGSGTVRVRHDDAANSTRVTGYTTLGTPIADLTGNFTAESTGTSPTRRLLLAASGITGFVGNNRGTVTTADDSGIQFTNGNLVAVINPNGTWAIDASGSAGVTGITGVALTGTFAATKNTTGTDVNESFSVGGTTRTLAVPKDASSFAGTATFSAENSVFLTGTIAVEKKNATISLADGSTVQTTAVQIGGSGLSGFAGLNAAPGSSDQTGVSLSNLSFGYTLATPVNSQSGTDRRTWSALRATVGQAELVGVDVVTASVANLSLNMNRAGGTLNGNPNTVTADFTVAPLANNVGGQSSTLDFKGSMLRATALIEFGISGFVNLRGRFGIEFGDMDVALPQYPGVVLPTNFVRFWGIDVDAAVGVNGPSWSNSDFTGFDISGLDFNLMLNMRNLATAPLPELGSMKWFTLNAVIPEISFEPFLEFRVPELPANLPKLTVNLTYDVPTLSVPVPWINYAVSQPTTTLPGLPAMLNFPGQPGLPALPDIPNFGFNVDAHPYLQISNLPNLSLFDFLNINGSLTFKRIEYTATLHDGTTVDTWAIVMNSVDGGVFAGVNGPASNSDATGLSVAGVDGAMAILVPKDSADKRRWVAAAGTGNAVSLVGLPDLTISATNFAVELNKSLGTATGGAANSSLVDFHANPLNVLMDDGSTVTITHPASSGALLKVATDATIG